MNLRSHETVNLRKLSEDKLGQLKDETLVEVVRLGAREEEYSAMGKVALNILRHRNEELRQQLLDLILRINPLHTSEADSSINWQR